VILGVVLLVLVSTPRRLLTVVARAGAGWRLRRGLAGGDTGRAMSMPSAHMATRPRHFGTHFAVFGAALVKHATRTVQWISGR